MKRFFLCVFLFTTSLFIGCSEEEPNFFGDLYGTITDFQTGEPVRNAQVILSPSGASTISGNDGHFEFRSLDAGQYSINVSSDGYESNHRQVTVVPGQRISCDIHLVPKTVTEIFNVDPITLNFGTTQTQLAVTVTNDSPRETQWYLDLGQNTWLNASPISGQIGAGKSQTIVFSVNRAYLTKETSGMVTVSALGGSSAMTVNCSPSQQASSIMEILPLNIDFGNHSKEQTIRIKNNGYGVLNWTLFGIEEDAITVSDTSGTIQPEAAKVVAVKLDRSKIKNKNFVTSFIVSDGTTDQQVNINVGTPNGETPESPEDPYQPNIEPSTRTIYYTSINGNIVMPNEEDFGANIISNTYENGLGTIKLDSDIQNLGDRAFYGCNTLATITLPESIMVVGFETFEGCTALGSINMPNVQWVGPRAFVDCFNLKTLYGQYVSSDNKSVTADNTLVKVVPSGISTYTIPDNVTSIANGAMLGCESVETIKLHDGITYIGSYAFAGCSNLRSINLPNNMTSIPYQLFQHCINLESIKIPESVTTIDTWSFNGCESLTELTIPKNVTLIGTGAFQFCTNLSKINCTRTTPPVFEYDDANSKYTQFMSIADDCKIYVPDGSYYAYVNADGWAEYKDMIVKPEAPSVQSRIFYTSTDGTIVTPYDTSAFLDANGNALSIISNTYENGEGVISFDGYVAEIGNSAFMECESLIDIIIPENVTCIGQHAFQRCVNLKSINLPESVTEIKNSAFSFCTSLANVKLPNGLTTIRGYAFFQCQSLTSITIPESVTYIDTKSSVFCICNNLKAIYGKYASSDNRCLIFDDVLCSFAPAGLTSYTIPSGITEIAGGAFQGYNNMTEIVIPNGVRKIGGMAFDGCSLTNVSIPDGVEEIGVSAFSSCKMSSITIPESVTTLGRCVFYWCENLSAFYGKFASSDNRCLVVDGYLNSFAAAGLSKYVIPDNVSIIGESSFRGMSNIKQITIPSSVKEIESSAFEYCNKLAIVECKPTTPPTLGYSVFDSNVSNRKIYVPTSVVNDYKIAENWSDYADNIVGYDF